MNDTTNFEKALEQLKTFLKKPVQDDRDSAGVIQAFEFTFEQAWKTIQKIATREGVPIGSPKKAFGFALQSGWLELEEESIWLTMIQDRNLSSHTDQQKLAKEIFHRIQAHYVTALEKLLTQIQKN